MLGKWRQTAVRQAREQQWEKVAVELGQRAKAGLCLGGSNAQEQTCPTMPSCAASLLVSNHADNLQRHQRGETRVGLVLNPFLAKTGEAPGRE